MKRREVVVVPENKDKNLLMTWSSDQSLTYKGVKLFFPFSCQLIFQKLSELRVVLYSGKIYGNDLSTFPKEIFYNTDLKINYDLSAWTYNVIEDWIMDVEFRVYDGKKKRLLDSFLIACEKVIITESKKTDTESDSTNTKLNLKSIFNPENNSFSICKEAMEELEITIDGIPNTKKGRVGNITGLITVLRETPGMLRLEKQSDLLILQYFNSYLKTSYKTFSKRNEDFQISTDLVRRLLARTPLKKCVT